MTSRRNALFTALIVGIAVFAVNMLWRLSRGDSVAVAWPPNLIIAILLGTVAYGAARLGPRKDG
jgi:hypothetical protein